MDEFPTNCADLFDEEQSKQGRHWLRVVMLAPELTFRILRYVYTQAEPRLSRFVDSLDATRERNELRARMGFPPALNTLGRRNLRSEMGPGTFSDLASLFRDMPHLEELNLWRRKAVTREHAIDFEGRELLAAYARDIVEAHPTVYAHGVGLGWGPWPDLREVGVSCVGNAPLLEGGSVHYCKQFAFWGRETLERILATFDSSATEKLGVWEFCTGDEVPAPFWIGLHPENEHEAMFHQYHLRASRGVSHQMGAVILNEREIDTYVARNQGVAVERDEIARRFHEARVHRNQSAILTVTRPPLRFVLET